MSRRVREAGEPRRPKQGRDRGGAVGRVTNRARAMKGVLAVFSAAALALAVATPPCRAAGSEGDQEVRLLYRPLDPPAGQEGALPYRPPATEAGRSESPRNGGRALLEFGTLLLYENLRYWAEAGFVEDWQYELTWDDQKKKLLELDGVRFDSNGYETNWTHAYAGGIYYSLGRINNLGVKESFLLAAFASLYWESVVEWREVFSVNDTIFTDFGALSIGEPWYQLARYLATRPDRVTRGLGFIHPLMGLQVALDPASRPAPTESQTLPGYGVFLALGAVTTDSRYASDSGGSVHVGLRSRLALAPGFTSPGTERRQGWDVLSSSFVINADLDGGAARELDVSSGAVFYGLLERRVGEDSRGSASILGAGSAFTMFNKAAVTVYDAGQIRVGLDDLNLEEPRDFRDKYSIVHLFGPVYEGYWRGSTATITWGLEAYPDFALVNAYALNDYSLAHDIAGAKTTLLYSGYYYGYGASGLARLELGAGPVTFGVAASLHYHESIEGLDRFEDTLTADVHASDTWYRFETRLGVGIPGTPLAVEASARWSHRRGDIGDTVATGTESRYALGVTWRL
ncbi:MAG: DUF3943 domain-containing protein [Candidatus Methylomirabilia bacterium]